MKANAEWAAATKAAADAGGMVKTLQKEHAEAARALNLADTGPKIEAAKAKLAATHKALDQALAKQKVVEATKAKVAIQSAAEYRDYTKAIAELRKAQTEKSAADAALKASSTRRQAGGCAEGRSREARGRSSPEVKPVDVDGTSGNDVFHNTEKTENVTGGDGIDKMVFAEGKSGVRVSLDGEQGSIVDAFGNQEKVTGVEVFVGTSLNDTMEGSANAVTSLERPATTCSRVAAALTSSPAARD